MLWLVQQVYKGDAYEGIGWGWQVISSTTILSMCYHVFAAIPIDALDVLLI